MMVPIDNGRLVFGLSVPGVAPGYVLFLVVPLHLLLDGIIFLLDPSLYPYLACFY